MTFMSVSITKTYVKKGVQGRKGAAEADKRDRRLGYRIYLQQRI